MPRTHQPDRPSKVCVACGRPFAWRKKWERDWEQVKYCSERCRRSRGKNPLPPGGEIPLTNCPLHLIFWVGGAIVFSQNAGVTQW